jgi:hypothetical protein
MASLCCRRHTIEEDEDEDDDEDDEDEEEEEEEEYKKRVMEDGLTVDLENND